MGPQILNKFCSCTIESMVGCITVWYGNCSASDRKALQRVVRKPQYITGATFPAIQDLNFTRASSLGPKGSLKPFWDRGQHFHFWMNSMPRVNCLLLGPKW